MRASQFKIDNLNKLCEEQKKQIKKLNDRLNSIQMETSNQKIELVAQLDQLKTDYKHNQIALETSQRSENQVINDTLFLMFIVLYIYTFIKFYCKLLSIYIKHLLYLGLCNLYFFLKKISKLKNVY